MRKTETHSLVSPGAKYSQAFEFRVLIKNMFKEIYHKVGICHHLMKVKNRYKKYEQTSCMLVAQCLIENKLVEYRR